MEDHRSQIAISSPQEGLDYACQLIASGSRAWALKNPETAPSMYQKLAGYVEFRYNNELELALGCLVKLGRACPPDCFQSEVFWRQIRWVAQECKVRDPDIPVQ